MIGCEDHWTTVVSERGTTRAACTVHGTAAEVADDRLTFGARARLADACLVVDSSHLADA